MTHTIVASQDYVNEVKNRGYTEFQSNTMFNYREGDYIVFTTPVSFKEKGTITVQIKISKIEVLSTRHVMVYGSVTDGILRS